MLKRSKGFTLIELLIVVAIIGILAALLIPNALSAIQKAKQKGTMKDINTIATGITDYITDKGQAPAFSAQIASPSDSIITAISPFYIKAFPQNDQWGFGFIVYTRDAAGTEWNIGYGGGEELGTDEYVVGSYARDGESGPQADYNPAEPSSALYQIDSMVDFNNDLVVWSGAWIIGPRTGAAS